METPKDVTQLLQAWDGGDNSVADRLMPLVYDELRSIAEGRLRGERAGHTLQATALVNEAYIRMVGSDIQVQGRSHFFALAARVMRRVLVDHARARDAAKRGGGASRVSLTEAGLVAPQDDPGVLAVHEALTALERQDERKARVTEMLIFAGMTYDEVAEALGISAATVDRDFRFSKAWLSARLEG